MTTQFKLIKVSTPHLITWFILTIILVSIAYIPIIKTGELGDTAVLLMFAPAISAILTTLIFNRNLRGLGWKPGPARLLLMSYGLPILVLTVAYLIIWITTGSFYDADWVASAMVEMNESMGTSVTSPTAFIALNGVVSATVTVLLAGFFATGEQIGWRGFLVPALAQRMSFAKVGLVSGLVWAAYHYPFFIFVFAPRLGVSWMYLLPVGTIAAIGLSYILAWLRLRSGGIWAVVIFHATVNGLTQGHFDNLTIKSGITPYLIGDAGLVTMLAWVIVAYFFWRKRDLLPQIPIQYEE